MACKAKRYTKKVFGGSTFHEYSALAEQMYRIREYEQCKTYCFKWLNLPNPAKPQPLKKYTDVYIKYPCVSLSPYRTV